jgi:nucleoside-diphosphate-sugar epimerase
MDLASKRIFVTGGRGFVGRHLVARLGELGCRGEIGRASCRERVFGLV